MTQVEMVKEYMLSGHSITPNDADKLFAVKRLSHIIYVLKKRGYLIGSETENSINRFGAPVHYSRYYMIKDVGNEQKKAQV